MSRIHELSERRQRLWSRPWHKWQSDHEAHANNLAKRLEEEYAERRKADAQLQRLRRSDPLLQMRGL